MATYYLEILSSSSAPHPGAEGSAPPHLAPFSGRLERRRSLVIDSTAHRRALFSDLTIKVPIIVGIYDVI